jgi:diphthamide synthase (EF-2-diphthine--ammonia ligase)
VRSYREEKLKGSGIKPIFPLWGTPTDKLSREIISSGLRAVTTCVDPKQIPEKFIGREYNESFLKDLPEGVDLCGEKGEFHSFVFDGPMFKEPIEITLGNIVNRDNFIFVDVSEKTPQVINKYA